MSTENRSLRQASIDLTAAAANFAGFVGAILSIPLLIPMVVIGSFLGMLWSALRLGLDGPK